MCQNSLEKVIICAKQSRYNWYLGIRILVPVIYFAIFLSSLQSALYIYCRFSCLPNSPCIFLTQLDSPIPCNSYSIVCLSSITEPYLSLCHSEKITLSSNSWISGIFILFFAKILWVLEIHFFLFYQSEVVYLSPKFTGICFLKFYSLFIFSIFQVYSSSLGLYLSLATENVKM